MDPEQFQTWLAVVSPARSSITWEKNVPFAQAADEPSRYALSRDEHEPTKTKKHTKPRSGFAIDKQVVSGKTINAAAVDRYYAELLPFAGKGKQRSARLILQTSTGPLEVELETSKMEWRAPHKKYANHRYPRNFNIRFPRCGNKLVGKLDLGRYNAYCDDHSWTNRDPDCAECKRLTSLRCNIQLEVNGFGCLVGLRPALMDAFFNWCVDAQTIITREIHLAIDVDIPFFAAVLVQVGAGREAFLTCSHSYNGPCVAPGYYLGRFRGKKYVCAYGKLAKIWRDFATDPHAYVPRHAAGWTDISRFELRLRPYQLGLLGTPEQTLEHALRYVLPSLVVIDMRSIPQRSALAYVLLLAKRDGILPPALHQALEEELDLDRIPHLNLGVLADAALGGPYRLTSTLPRRRPKHKPRRRGRRLVSGRRRVAYRQVTFRV